MASRALIPPPLGLSLAFPTGRPKFSEPQGLSWEQTHWAGAWAGLWPCDPGWRDGLWGDGRARGQCPSLAPVDGADPRPLRSLPCSAHAPRRVSCPECRLDARMFTRPLPPGCLQSRHVPSAARAVLTEWRKGRLRPGTGFVSPPSPVLRAAAPPGPGAGPLCCRPTALVFLAPLYHLARRGRGSARVRARCWERVKGPGGSFESSRLWHIPGLPG